ncbi:MAG TPA: hypothetical protein VK595_14465 [Vicinamibacterales bacterium]|nr:hypothetical protein [Vicinamibacterales bacterium]
MSAARVTVWQVLAGILRHPVRHMVTQWNWKSAVVSAAARALIFLVANLPAGVDAGLRAMLTELMFRGIVSGALGSLTQAFSRASPPRDAALVALIVLPAIAHTAEFFVHRQAGTARLGPSVIASIGFSVVTTTFNLFAMRRGALIVGPGKQSLASDLRRMPALMLGFAASIARALTSRRRRSRDQSCPTRHCI